MDGGTPDLMISFGGDSRADVLTMLSEAGVHLNAHAETLLADLEFDGQPERTMTVTIRSVAALGLAEGGTLSQVFDAAAAHGLQLVPLTAAPSARLAFHAQEQAPDAVLSQGRAPTGSVHIASEPLSNDPEYPKGFYLRVIDGQPWLRGYRCDDRYVFEPEQDFLFACR